MSEANSKRRQILKLAVVVLLALLGLILLLKLTGKEVSDWFFVTDSLLLIICGIAFRNFSQAVKDDEKFGGQ